MNEKPKLFIVCTTPRDKREIPAIAEKLSIDPIFHDYDDADLDGIICRISKEITEHILDPAIVIDQLIEIITSQHIQGIIASDDYPGSLYASLIAEKLGFSGPSIVSLLQCHHKYAARLLMQRFVPEATPAFDVIHKERKKNTIPAPFFAKPIKSYFSVNAHIIPDFQLLETLLDTIVPPKLFLYQFDWFLKNYLPEHQSGGVLIEQLLSGIQITVEGFVFNGEVSIIGVVDSIMFPNTFSFARFEYPSQLSASVQERVSIIAQKFVSSIGFDNALFNIEMMYNPQTDEIFIIEVNPRMASQFADLYEKVDGVNSYELLLSIALGKKPRFCKNNGKYKVASSFVLRSFDDARMLSVPCERAKEKFFSVFPDGRLEIFINEGQKLSETLQDGKSFRYGLIHLGAHDWQELYEKYDYARQLLPFSFG